jgi:hypothetical protein
MKNLIIVLVVAFALMSCTTKEPAQPVSLIDEVKTQEVLDHHLKAFKENDLDATMADYTEESILVTPDATSRGLAEIRKGFEGAFATFPKDSTTLDVSKTVIIQDIAYIVWTAKAPKVEVTYGTDTFIIRDGKIVRQTFAGAMK